MSNKQIKLQPWMEEEETRKVMAALEQEGDESRFVGGCVRDAILGKKIKDIDIGTTHLPTMATQLLQEEGIKVIPTGIDHGTVTAVINKKHFEITTLRRDIDCDGRYATVKFTDNWEEDAARRDFTINALSMDLSGNVYDYFGGIEDLEKGVLRFVGDSSERIKEDYLRILRFFRFYSYYGKGVIETDQIKACGDNIDGLKNLSGERIQAEMIKILNSPDPLYVISIMDQIGILKEIIPGFTSPLEMWVFQILLENNIGNIDRLALIRLASILIINEPTEEKVNALSDRWKLSNDDKKYLLNILFSPFVIKSDNEIADVKRAIRLLGNEQFIEHSFLYEALEDYQHQDKKNSIQKAFKEMRELAKTWNAPEFPLSGGDLLKAGVEEGQELGKLLKKAEDYWESKDYKSTKEELLKYVL